MWWQATILAYGTPGRRQCNADAKDKYTPTVAVVLVSRALRVSSTTCGLSAILTVQYTVYSTVPKWVFQVSFVIPTRGCAVTYPRPARARPPSLVSLYALF